MSRTSDAQQPTDTSGAMPSCPNAQHRLTVGSFDFHKECRGMRFENVSHLIDRIQPDMDSIECVLVLRASHDSNIDARTASSGRRPLRSLRSRTASPASTASTVSSASSSLPLEPGVQNRRTAGPTSPSPPSLASSSRPSSCARASLPPSLRSSTSSSTSVRDHSQAVIFLVVKVSTQSGLPTETQSVSNTRGPRHSRATLCGT